MNCMSTRSFLDTKVLVYTDNHDTPDKQRVALDLVEELRLRRTGAPTQLCERCL